MSRAPYWIPGLRWGQHMNNAAAVDVMVGALTDPFDEVHMGLTAENIARKWGISREDQDAFRRGEPPPRLGRRSIIASSRSKLFRWS